MTLYPVSSYIIEPKQILPTGIVAGATGAFIGTPAEISLIRMTSDGRSVFLVMFCFPSGSSVVTVNETFLFQ